MSGPAKIRFIDWTARFAHIAVQIQWEPHDMWIGAFWRFDRWKGEATGSDRKHGAISAMPWSLHLYICLVPLLPIHVYVMRTIRP